MRLNMELVLGGIAVFVGAALQNVISATGAVPVKWPFLTAVALYYALMKPTLMALTVGAWAGLLTDVLGGLPSGCTCVFLALAYGGARVFQRVSVDAAVITGMALTGVAAALQQVWVRVWVRGTGVEVFSLEMLRLAGAAMAVGLAVGGLTFLVLGGVDRFVCGKGRGGIPSLSGIHGG